MKAYKISDLKGYADYSTVVTVLFTLLFNIAWTLNDIKKLLKKEMQK